MDKKQLRIITLLMLPVCVVCFLFLTCNMYLRDYIKRVNSEKYALEAQITRSYRRLMIKHAGIYMNDNKPDNSWINDFRGM